MAKIYGQANRVIVYLGEAADNSDQAIEDIRISAEDEFTTPSKKNQKAIIKLLERPWFRRIWVLQEVAAARCILIICGFVEINGYTFCAGLNKLELSLHTDLQNLIRSMSYLIRGAIFRPTNTADLSIGLSLSELIDMCHNRESTEPNDEVYALLGMCSDNPSVAGLLPDYTVSWKLLLKRLIEFILSKELSIETWDKKEIIVIRSKGHIIDQVSSVEDKSARYDRQFKRENVPVTEEVVKAAAGNEEEGAEIISLLLDQRSNEIKITEEVVKVAAGNVGSGPRVISLLLDRCGDKVKITERVTKAAAENHRCGQKVMKLLLDRRGNEVKITEELLIATTSNWGIGEEIMPLLLDWCGDEIKITEEVLKAAAGNTESGPTVMALLLDRCGDKFKITEEIVKAAAENPWCGEEVMELLLDRRSDEVKSTKEIFKAAASNKSLAQLLKAYTGKNVN